MHGRPLLRSTYSVLTCSSNCSHHVDNCVASPIDCHTKLEKDFILHRVLPPSLLSPKYEDPVELLAGAKLTLRDLPSDRKARKHGRSTVTVTSGGLPPSQTVADDVYGRCTQG